MVNIEKKEGFFWAMRLHDNIPVQFSLSVKNFVSKTSFSVMSDKDIDAYNKSIGLGKAPVTEPLKPVVAKKKAVSKRKTVTQKTTTP